MLPDINNIILSFIGDYSQLLELEQYFPGCTKYTTIITLDKPELKKNACAIIKRFAQQVVELDCQDCDLMDLPALPNCEYLNCSITRVYNLPYLPKCKKVVSSCTFPQESKNPECIYIYVPLSSTVGFIDMWTADEPEPYIFD